MWGRASGSTKGLSSSPVTIFHQSGCIPVCSWHLLSSGERVEKRSFSWAIDLCVFVGVGLVLVVYGNANKPQQSKLQGGSMAGQRGFFHFWQISGSLQMQLWAWWGRRGFCQGSASLHPCSRNTSWSGDRAAPQVLLWVHSLGSSHQRALVPSRSKEFSYSVIKSQWQMQWSQSSHVSGSVLSLSYQKDASDTGRLCFFKKEALCGCK